MYVLQGLCTVKSNDKMTVDGEQERIRNKWSWPWPVGNYCYGFQLVIVTSKQQPL
jgi:hypothetical protein